jgi:hypothetical protein
MALPIWCFGGFLRQIALLTCTASLLCYGQAVELEGRYWPTNVAATAKIEAARLNAPIDLRRDLGTNNPRVPDFRFTARPGRHRLQFAFDRLLFTGDQPVTRTVEFNGDIYTIGTRVVTDAKINHVTFGWNYPVVRAADGRFRLGPLVQGHGFWWDASLAAPSLNQRGADKRTIGFPTVGLATEIVAHRRLLLFGEASGITAGKYGSVYNLEAGVRVSPVTHLNLIGGFRVFDVNAKFEPDYARLRITGPFVGAGVQF